jgi:hypothetical protein
MITGKSITKSGYYDSTNGTVHPGTRLQIGQNGGFWKYWSGEYPFINVVKGADINNSRALIHNPPDNKTITWDYLPTGVWTLRWTVTSGTVNMTWVDENGGSLGTANPIIGDGTPAVNGGLNIIEYTVTDPIPGTFGIGTEVRFSGGGTYTDLQLLTAGDAARYDAGERMSSQWLSDNAGVACFRTMMWQKTNDSNIKDYSDFVNKDLNTYSFANHVSLEYCTKAAKELGAQLWICVPHMATDACVTSMFTEIGGYLAPEDYPIKVEYTNENWNTDLGFDAGSKWVELGDAPSYDIESANINTVTGVFTQTAHGMVTGDQIRMFDSRFGQDLALYSGAQLGRIIKLTDNTFQIGAGRFDHAIISSITKGATTVINCLSNRSDGAPDTRHYFWTFDDVTFHDIGGMTQLNNNTYEIIARDLTSITIDVDSTGFTDFNAGVGTNECFCPENNSTSRPSTQMIDAGVDFLRYKRLSESTRSRHGNYGDRSIEVWDLAEAALTPLGGSIERVLGGKAKGDGELISIIKSKPTLPKIVDYYTIANYFQAKHLDYELQTFEWMTDFANYNFVKDIHPSYAVHRNIKRVGGWTIPMIGYEGGDHNGGESVTDAQRAQLVGWFRDDQARRAYDESYRKFASWGVTLSCHFVSHLHADEDYNNSANPNTATGFQGTFGCMEHMGDTDAPQYIALKAFYDAGGAPAE